MKLGFLLTNRFIWGWKILILDSWGLSLTNIELSFGYPAAQKCEHTIVSAPSEVHPNSYTDSVGSSFLPLSFLLTASISAIFLAVFRKAIIKAAWSSLPLVSNWKLFPLLFKRETLQSRGMVFTILLFLHTAQTTPSQLGLPGRHQALLERTTPQAKTFPSKQTSRAWGLIWGFPANISKDAKWNSSSKKGSDFAFFWDVRQYHHL